MPSIIPTPINGWRVFWGEVGIIIKRAEALGLHPKPAPVPATFDPDLCKPVLRSATTP